MSDDHLVIGHFKFLDDTIAAVRKLREQGIGHKQVEVFSPLPNHDLEDEIYLNRPRSPVRRVTLTGAITGCLSAFLMTIWMSNDWPLRTSAKPVISIPPFVVIGFECTILFGGLFTLLALLHFCRVPNIFKPAGFRPNFTEDTFGIVVRLPRDRADSLKAEMEKWGAQFVEVQYAR